MNIKIIYVNWQKKLLTLGQIEESEAEVGFSVEYIHKHYGGFGPIAEAIRKGQILGVVNMIGCNNPKIMYEKAVLDLCDVLLKNNVLIITNGCASFPLMKMGYCQTSDFAYGKCGEGLREFLAPDMPPVWHVGECIDNARSSGIFAGIAAEFKKIFPCYAFLIKRKEGKLKKKDIKNDTIIFKGEDNFYYEKFQDGTVKCIQDEIPFEVPEGWEWGRLTALTALITKGASPKWQGLIYTSSGTMLITSENVGVEMLLLESPKFLPEKINEIQPRSVLETHDILTNIVGASIGRTFMLVSDGVQ